MNDHMGCPRHVRAGDTIIHLLQTTVFMEEDLRLLNDGIRHHLEAST